MKSEDPIYNITVQLPGMSSIAEIGRVAARGLSRIKNEPGKKYDYEVLRGHEFCFLEGALTCRYNLMSY
jgi:hypothetical protein